MAVQQPRGRSSRAPDPHQPLGEVLEFSDLCLTHDKFLVCLTCQCFVLSNFNHHISRGCKTRVHKHVNSFLVNGFKTELGILDFCTPEVLTLLSSNRVLLEIFTVKRHGNHFLLKSGYTNGHISGNNVYTPLKLGHNMAIEHG